MSKDEDEDKVNIPDSLLMNLDTFLDSKSDLSLPNTEYEPLKQTSTLQMLNTADKQRKRRKSRSKSKSKSKSKSSSAQMDPDDIDEKEEFAEKKKSKHKRNSKNISDDMAIDSFDVDQAVNLYQQNNTSIDFSQWNIDEIINWIININPDKYKKYEERLRENFVKNDINGSHLKHIDKYDLHNWGITDFQDKINILGKIVSLCMDIDGSDEDEEEEEEEEPKIYTLELPREMLTAYILLSLAPKFKSDWKEFGCCGQLGVFLAYVIPFGVQIIVTFALLSEVKLDKLRVDTSPQALMFNLCALSILFIYIFYKVVGLIKSTWTYLTKLKHQFDREKEKRDNRNNNNNDNDDDIIEQFSKSMEELKSIQLKSVDEIGNISIDEDDKRWLVIYAFRLQIVFVLILYFGLMMYAIVRINSRHDIADKLEVAISIFFILEVDDWAYSLFLGQNMILNDSDFDIEMIAQREKHSKQLKRNVTHLWISLFIVIISVTAIVVGSNWLYDLVNADSSNRSSVHPKENKQS